MILRLFLLCAFLFAPMSLADESIGLDQVVLRSGGILFGTVDERKEDGQSVVEIKTDSGTTLKFYRSDIKTVKKFDDLHREYLELKAKMENTVDGHWEMAEWAKTKLRGKSVNGISSSNPERHYHLKQILKLDPDHKEARSVLGYVNRKGRWIHKDKMAAGHGLIRYKQKWITRHELEVIQHEEAAEKVFKEWVRRLKKIRRGKNPHGEMRQVTQPEAVGPLLKLYKDEKLVEARLLYADTLNQIKTPGAGFALADWAVLDPSVLVRDRCLVHLKKDWVNRSAVGRRIIEAYLSSNDAPLINRAGFVLGELEVEEAVFPLIKKLNTVEIRANPNAKGSGNIGTSFGSGGSSSGIGMQHGSNEPSHLRIHHRNVQVLRALERLTGNGFEYNTDRWMNWYVESTGTYDVDLRRDE